MAKAVILDVLESTIGRYVLNLDTNSLNVAVWSGKIELQNLKLNVEAVNRKLAQKAAESPNLAIPFRVVDGSFSSIKLEVPWTRLTSRPVVFRAEGLHVLLEPFDHLAPTVDTEASITESSSRMVDDSTKPKKKKNPRLKSLKYAEEERQRFSAMKKLAVLDLDSSQAAEDDKDSSSSSSSFGARLARRIIENLQFEIEGVHLSVQGEGFSVGVQLDQLSLVTTDEMGNRSFIDRVSSSKEKSFLYKALAIHGFGIYCNEVMGATKNTSPSYILSPLSFDAKLRQSDCPKCIDFPKYLLSSQLEIVSIIVSRKQLEIIHNISTRLSSQLNVIRPLFPQYRPEVAVSRDTAKLWWKYAVRCVGRLNRRRSWTEFYLAFQKRKTYLQLYKRSAHSSTCNWLNPLSADEVSQLESLDIDRSISVDGVMNWRNLADAQVELEQKKRKDAMIEAKAQSKKKSMMSSIFGKKKSKKKVNEGGDSLTESDSMAPEEASPIDLTVEELKELELMTLSEASAMDSSLSTDSKLCDVKFRLGSFKVNLITFEDRPLAALEMGTTSITFLANADGSYSCEFSLCSLNIQDQVTVGSLFPLVVRSLQKSSKLSSMNNAMEIRFQKEKSGDQGLIFKMVAYEIVPSSLLIKEFKQFLTFTNDRRKAGPGHLQNPVLEKSISGDADLFYDASYGSAMTDLTTKVLTGDSQRALAMHSASADASGVGVLGRTKRVQMTNPTDRLTAALTDAWENKLVRKTKWSVELVINAPIFVLPISSTDPLSSVLAFDLGNFHFMYGNVEASDSVRNWYESQSMSTADSDSFDFCRLEMQHLSFVIGTAGNRDWDTSKVREVEKRPTSSETIIEPISFSISVGIANPSSKSQLSRSCLFGVLPAITLRLSYSQISRILSVVACWVDVLDSLKSNQVDIITIDEIVEDRNHSMGNAPSPADEAQVASLVGCNTIVDITHISFKLNKLSLIVCSEDDESVEAHLVSAEATHISRSDRSTITNVKMGFFWVIDKLHYPQMPRRQRFLVRSSLPKAARYLETQTHGESYFVQELDSLGARANLIENDSLADITVSSRVNYDGTIDSRLPLNNDERPKGTVVMAKFHSLFINWNPTAVRSLILFERKITELADKLLARSPGIQNTTKIRGTSLDILSPAARKDQTINKATVNADSTFKMRKRGHSSDFIKGGPVSLFSLQAEMKSFEITLNSARDDLPLYTLKMSGTRVSFQSLNGTPDAIVKVVVGDIRLEIPSTGKTLDSYCAILGLSPDQSSSLISAVYFKGSQVIERDPSLPHEKNVDAIMTLSLSPMRFVYIQAQIMTLVEYITQGIVGAITAETKTDMIQVNEKPKSGESVFIVNASGFDIVVPESAYSKSNFRINCDEFGVNFRLLTRPGQGNANIYLKNVTMEGDQEGLVTEPIQLNIKLLLGPLDTTNEEEKALSLELDISRVSFTMTRRQYVQLMLMIDNNIGEDDPFLRDADFTGSSISKGESRKIMTHGGVQAITVQRRINVHCRSEAVVLDICGMNATNPLATIAALETVVVVQLVHDENTIRVYATMNDLTCEDRRFVAFNRSFRYIVKQVTDNQKQDVFNLEYEKSKLTGDMNINLAIGSPQIAVVPDAIVDIKSFFVLDTDTKKRKTLANEEVGNIISNINVTHDETSIEASMQGTASLSEISRALNLSFKTDDIRLVLIDMGCKVDDVTASIRNTPLTETIVCQGKSEASIALSYNRFDSLISTNIQLHGERIEVYSATGKDLVSPVQLMEPLKFSLFINTRVCDGRQETDVSFVTLSTLDMSVSMQNMALFQAILTTMSDSFSVPVDSESQKSEILSTLETAQIEKLSRALENQELLEADSYQVAGFENSVRDIIVQNDQKYSSDEGKSINRKLAIKLTLPEVTILVINDLQGLDEALFKVIVQECVFLMDTAIIKAAGPQFIDRRALNRMSGESSTLLFYSQMNASLLADYYDNRRNSWKHLLVKPWEINIKATRGKSQRFTSRRMMTAVDVESHPCCVDFSERFIISLGAATSMWTVYSGATKKAISDDIIPLSSGSGESHQRSKNTTAMVKSMALNAARSLITTMPYGLNNRCGLVVDFEVGDNDYPGHAKRYRCAPGTTEFFRFEPRKRAGSGGWRSYGQDVIHNKSVFLFIAGVAIHIEHVDKEIGSVRRAHDIGLGRYVFSEVTKTGKTTVLHLSSYVDIRNETSMVFNLQAEDQGIIRQIGLLQSRGNLKRQRSVVSQSSTTVHTVTDSADVLGLPIDLVFTEGEQDKDIQLYFSTNINGRSLSGIFHLPSRKVFRRLTLGGKYVHIFELLLSSDPLESMAVSLPASRAVSVDQMVLCAICKITVVDNIHPLVEMYLRPRARLENKLHVDISVQTPMPHTYSGQQSDGEDEMTYHALRPFDSIEIFTRGPSVAAKFKCASVPDAGDMSDWTVWMEIPLGLNKQLSQPMKGCFPFVGQDGRENRVCRGNMFVMVEENGSFDSSNEDNVDPGIRTLSIAAENLGIDHTREIVFQAYFSPDQQTRMNVARINSNPLTKFSFSTFPSALLQGKISLLPDSTVPLRIVTVATKNRNRKSLPFLIEDIAFCNGGLESSPIFWDDEKPSGYFAYRKLSVRSKMELHIIPSFVIYNGGKDRVVVQMSHSEEIQLGPGEIAPLLHSDHRLGLIVQLHYPSHRLITSPVNVESLGSKVSLTKKVPSGAAVGSVTLQTVIGYQDSCFVVNIGSIKYGRKPNVSSSWFRDDFLRLRVRWSIVDVTFNDTARADPSRDGNTRQLSPAASSPLRYSVVRILMERFTVDFQRIFKAEEVVMDEKLSPERSQFSMIMKNVIITDCISNTIVLQSSSNALQSPANNGNFFDLCIRTRGSEDSGIILVDLFDLKFSQASGLSVPLIIKTNEAFLWSLIDIASRIKLAIGELSGVDMELTWDESKGEYSISVIHVPVEERALSSAKGGVYRPPASDRLLSVRVASVSPVALRFSFKRQPQRSRYTLVNQVDVGANLLNYFTTRLKFTVDNAELKFPGYIQKQAKGPPDQIIEEIKAFYLSQLKFKLLHLVTATSLDDWKDLVGREVGTEGYVEGDILRLTGNLAGRSANFILKRVGSGIGSGVQVGSEVIGNSIQVFSEALGVGAVGAGVNSVVSGLGEGVGKSVTSIGVGTGKVLKGAGKGLGHVVGGVGGGIEQMAKGISKGVISGDGRLVVEGLGGGALSVGAGLVEGADSLVTGAAEGVISAGKGLFEGVQSLGKGIGGIFYDSQKDKRKSSHKFNR